MKTAAVRFEKVLSQLEAWGSETNPEGLRLDLRAGWIAAVLKRKK